MPRGKVRDWQGKIGTVVSETGVQHLFMSNDLQGLPVEEVADGLIVEFDSVKAGSSWQAKKVRRSDNQSWGGGGSGGGGGGGKKAAKKSVGWDVAGPSIEEMLTRIPVPAALLKTVVRVPSAERHPGLQLDKFLIPGDQEAQHAALQQVADIPPGSAVFDEVLARRCDLLAVVGATVWSRTTSSALTLHLSRASALENAGLCLHPIHGFVYLPGSGIKGLTRAYADQVWKPNQPDETAAQQTIERVFGAMDSAGAVVFHDAWPSACPRLIVDIVNNHHVPYYEGKEGPGDWQEPNPVYFLAVPPGATFAFALSARQIEDGNLVTQARQWLDGALTHRGVGAKTNAGYGTFAQPTGEVPLVLTSPRFATFEATLTLTTPAYLAGASQKEADCDLRPATVRGLLRWWWRTLHSGFVNPATMHKMESLLWGDTAAGGAIQVRVERVPGSHQPMESPYKDVNPENNRTRFSRQFQDQHGIWDAPRGRTPGLMYAGYGMDEGNPPERKRRWVMPAGASWRLTLTAQDRGSLKAADILKQAKAGLWWLCYLGGAGSRSRKGFGSFADPAELKDFEGGRWLSLGKEFREAVGVPETPFNASWAASPAIYLMRDLAKRLNQNPWLEVPTVWTDPWRAIDEIGMAMQQFAQAAPSTDHGSHCDAKRYLGLPRNLHGPRPRPMDHQNSRTHQPPQDLRAIHGERHSAPIFYHVAMAPAGTLTLRVAAFPTASLRPKGMGEVAGLQHCTNLHYDLLADLATYLQTRKDER